MKTPLATLLLFAAAASQMGATGTCGQVTRDPGFDLWCGDQLCAWKVERGDVARVPTWNEGDPGVELVGADAAIEQLAPVNNGDGTCIEFDLIANIDQDAQVTLNVDVDGDGTLEQMEQLPTSSWKPLSFLIKIKAPYSGVRFELAKRGAGHAVLAQIDAKTSTQCGDIAVLDPGPQPDGEPCQLDDECASGKCRPSAFLPPFGLTGFTSVCEACDASSCTNGDVCGAGLPASPVRAVPTACVAPASAELGEQCVTSTECASGICTSGVCSACDEIHVCPGGETCAQAWPGNGLVVASPQVCSPSGGTRAPGESCASDADCRSHACSGTPRMQCDDGRPCGNNADCPFGDTGSSGLQNGACATVGVQGGSCQ